jgi:UDP-glucose 4-epimerase
MTLCQAMADANIFNVVFSSSATVYGAPSIVPIAENHPAGQITNPYGRSKFMIEQMLTDLAHSDSRWKIAILRYFNPVGAHPTSEIGEFPIGKPNNLLPYITQTAAGKLEQLTVFGNDYSTPDGTCIRDYIHVVDLAGAHVAALDFLNRTEGPLIEAINIGTGKGTSVLEMIHTFEKVSGKELNWQFGARRPGDVVEIYANADKAKRLLGWTAKLSAEDAIRDAWNWEMKLASHG